MQKKAAAAPALMDSFAADQAGLVALRRDLHAHPEIGLEEVRTSEIVAKRLAELGYRVDKGLAKTGVVGTLKVGSGRGTVGIRADIDALPIHEATGLAYASKTAGKMHACGHDGHTTMLLGAARKIAERRNFDGTVHLIFQPAEENWGGAKIMMDEGLFKKFPCDRIFALHNEPGQAAGQIGYRSGPIMAAVDQVQITIRGKGGHGAQPEKAVDPIVAGASVVMALQTIVSRNVDPLNPAVITVGCLRAGFVCNVIPETAFMDCAIRHFDKATGKLLRSRIDACAQAQAKSFGAKAEVSWIRGYPVTVNEEASTDIARDTAIALLGKGKVKHIARPYLGSEDFAFMLEERPGSYVMLGNGDSAGLHNPEYNFNDDIIPVGAAYWTALAERVLRPA